MIQQDQLNEEEIKSLYQYLNPNLEINIEDDFRVFVETQSVYVDKSLLIKEIFENNEHIFITAPSRWGKSLNLSMLKYFFQPDGDDLTHYLDGKYDFSKPNKYSILFTGGEIKAGKILPQLKIANNENTSFYENNQGKNPIIYLNFKTISLFKDINEQKKKLRNQIKTAFEDHFYLFYNILISSLKILSILLPDIKLDQIKWNTKSEMIDVSTIFYNNYKEKLCNIELDMFYSYYTADDSYPLEESLVLLAKLMYDHFGDKKIFILVDEFDKPVISHINSLIEGYSNLEQLMTIKSFVMDIINTSTSIVAPLMKTTGTPVCRVILTGILNTVDKEISSSANPLYDISVTDTSHRLSMYFGFKEEDLELIIKKVFNSQAEENLLNSLKTKFKLWYHGQKIGNNVMYTPSSVMQYFKSLINYSSISIPYFKPFWKFTQDNILEEMLTTVKYSKIKFDSYIKSLTEIVAGKHVSLPFEENTTLKSLTSNFNNFEKLFTYLLLKFGYLTIKNHNKLLFGFPAKEVNSMLKYVVIENWLNNHINSREIDNFEKIAKQIDFLNDNQNVIDSNLSSIIKLFSSNVADFNENVFEKIMFTTYLLSKENTHTIISQVFSGDGKLDLCILFPEKANLYELKFDEQKHKNKRDRTKANLKKASQQIIQKKYMSIILDKQKNEIQHKKIEKINCIPIILCRDGSNSEWYCKSGNIITYSLEEAEKKCKDKESVENDSEEIEEKENNIDKKINKKSNKKRGKGFHVKSDSELSYCNITYESNSLISVLKERILEENLVDVKVCDALKPLSSEESSIEEIKVLIKSAKECSLEGKRIIIPYAQIDHYIGLVFEKDYNSFKLSYLDSCNNLEQYEKNFIELKNIFNLADSINDVVFNQVPVNPQIFADNCGVETIENLIGYLNNENLLNRKISQSEALSKHKFLFSDYIQDYDLYYEKINNVFKKRALIESNNENQMMNFKKKYEPKSLNEYTNYEISNNVGINLSKEKVIDEDLI